MLGCPKADGWVINQLDGICCYLMEGIKADAITHPPGSTRLVDIFTDNAAGIDSI
jgi:hypothetical protein